MRALPGALSQAVDCCVPGNSKAGFRHARLRSRSIGPDGLSEKAVVRLHGEVDRAGNPDIAADEFRVLEIVQAAGIPVPAPLYLDTSCELFEIPYLVVAFVEGETGS